MTEIFILATKRLTLSKVVLTGNQISPTGKFTLSLGKRLFMLSLALRRRIDFSSLNPSLPYKIFSHNDFTYSDLK